MGAMKITRRWWDPVYRYAVAWDGAYKLHKTQMGVSQSGRKYEVQGPFYVMTACAQHFIEALPKVRWFWKIKPACKYRYRTGRLAFTHTTEPWDLTTSTPPPVILMARKSDALMLKLACAGQ